MKFSIIVPTYNYGHFISQCLQSISEQVYNNWECIIIDNASTDNTEEVCKSFLKDGRFIYHKLTDNKGPSIARNYALNIVSGEYVLFLDADDTIEVNKLLSANQIINNYKIDVVFTNHAFFKTSPNEIYAEHNLNDKFQTGILYSVNVNKFLISGNIFVISSPITRKEVFDRIGFFDEKIKYNEDWELWLRMSFEDVLFYYDSSDGTRTLIRNHSTSHSKDDITMYLSGIYVCKKNMNKFSGNSKNEFKLKLLSQRYLLTRMLFERYASGQKRKKDLIFSLNNNSLATNELLFSRKILSLIPTFMVPMYLFIIKIKYVILKNAISFNLYTCL